MGKLLKRFLPLAFCLAVLSQAHAEPLTFNLGDLKYQEIDGKPGCVQVLTYADNVVTYSKPLLVIPSTVEYEGITYKVLGVGGFSWYNGYNGESRSIEEVIISEGIEFIRDNAFECAGSMRDLKKMVLPSSLKKIGSYAFARLGVGELTIPDSVEEIGFGAFFGSTALKKLTLGKGLTHIPTILGFWFEESPSYGQHFDGVENLYLTLSTPPSVTDDMVVREPTEHQQIVLNLKFPKDYEQCTLHVPAGSLEAYKNHPAWGKFKHIVDDAESGIEDAVADASCTIKVEGGRIVAEGNVEVYDLGGRKVAEGLAEDLPDLPAGFYIVRTPDATAKVVL